MFRRATLLLVFVFAFHGAGFADPILIRGLERSIGAGAFVKPERDGRTHGEQFTHATSDAGLFSRSETADVSSQGARVLAHASQNTTIAPDLRRWFGSGRASTEPQLEREVNSWQAAADSMMSVVFTLTEPVPYHLTGTRTAEGNAFAQVTLFSSNPDDTFFVTAPNFTKSGVLPAGRYAFLADANVGWVSRFLARTGSAAFDVDFTLGTPAPVPEPTSVGLLGGALIAALLRRRRKQPDAAPH